MLRVEHLEAVLARRVDDLDDPPLGGDVAVGAGALALGVRHLLQAQRGGKHREVEGGVHHHENGGDRVLTRRDRGTFGRSQGFGGGGGGSHGK